MDPSGRISLDEKRLLTQKLIAAESVGVREMLDALKDLERYADEADLGPAYWIVARKLLEEAYDDYEKVLYFANRVLRIMTPNNNSDDSITIVETLQIIAFICSEKLNKFDVSLKYLNRAVKILEKLEENNTVLRFLHSVHLQLYRLKHSMGTNEGCISYLKKNLDITEKLSGENSREFAQANEDLSFTLFSEAKYAESLPFCLKALKIYVACGDNDQKIAECSKQLGAIRCIIGEHGTALEHNQLSLKLLKKLCCTSFLLIAEMDAANILTKLGRLDESVQALRDIILRTEEDSYDRVTAYTSLAHALLEQGKLSDAKECSEIVCGILEKKKNSTLELAVGFSTIAEVYCKMNEFETAVQLLHKALVTIQQEEESPFSMKNKLIEQMSGRLAELLQFTGKCEEAILHLEVKVESVKKNFGWRHVKVGHNYCMLGYVYVHTNKLKLAAECFVYAKDILEESLGSLHEDSILMCRNLYSTYEAMGRYSDAMKFLEEYIKRLDSLRPNMQDKLDEAATLMAKLKEVITGGKAVSAMDS